MSKELDFLEEVMTNYLNSPEYEKEMEEYLMKEFIKDFGLDQPKQLDMYEVFGEY